MYRTIFIGGINRSGGSLLARLFDGHPDVATYPYPIGFPRDNNIYPIFESFAGIPSTVPSYDPAGNKNIFKLLDIPEEKSKVVLKWGKETSDPIGIRKNYFEHNFYDKVKTDFDFDKFKKSFNEFGKKAQNIVELYEARHKAYFLAWDNGKYDQNKKYIVLQTSSGLYLTNADKYFEEFKDSTFIHPVRDVMGYIGSEKTRLARRYYGSRRFSYPRFPNFLVKTFRNYDLEAQIRAWMVAITRVALLQEKYGAYNRFIVYRNENLLNKTEETMRSICEKIGLNYHPILLKPTIAEQPWSGNSHQGKQKGINKNLATYYHKVLASDEIVAIEKATAPIREYLCSDEQTPVNLADIPKDVLFDYKYQKKYFNDDEKLALYSALLNSSRRRVMIKSPGFIAIIAYLYSKMVRIIHIPRMLKLRFFPGHGKQNYT